MSLHPTSDPLGIAGTLIADKYRIGYAVGEGGFSVVYRAEHTIWKQPVALKCFTLLANAPPDQREHLLHGFVQEGKLLAELSSRSAAIVQARDIGTFNAPDGQWLPYMVLEWLEGKPLDLVLHDETGAGLAPRSVYETLTLLEPAAIALELVHSRGIAHRDVKPANVFVIGPPRDVSAFVKVLDFGIAKVMAEHAAAATALAHTGKDITAFTPSYGAPEQFSRTHGATGPWTDVFAMALIMVEVMLGGEAALRGDDYVQLAVASRDPSTRPTPRTLGIDVGGAVEAVFEKALAVAPADRYPTMGRFWAALYQAVFPDSPTWTVGGGGAPQGIASGYSASQPSYPQLAPPIGAASQGSQGAARGPASYLQGAARGPASYLQGAPPGSYLQQLPGGAYPQQPPGGAPGSYPQPPSGAMMSYPSTPQPMLSQAGQHGPSHPHRAPGAAPKAEGGFSPGALMALASVAVLALVAGGFIAFKVFGHGASSPGQAPGPLAAASIAPCASSPSPTAPTPGARPSAATVARRTECPGGMVLVPGGRFFMGSDDPAFKLWQPSHKVTIDTFCIDAYEVTAIDYKACSDLGECRRPPAVPDFPKAENESEAEHARTMQLLSELCTFGKLGKEQHPINCVPWSLADAYCRVESKRLPTEAEWEFAARGSDGRKYPWGDAAFDHTFMNACGSECTKWEAARGLKASQRMYDADDGFFSTAPVGSFPKGKTKFGAYDVIGNVWEWTADWFETYKDEEQVNPRGAPAGDRKAIRGGGYNGGFSLWVNPAFRYHQVATASAPGIGFRCVTNL